ETERVAEEHGTGARRLVLPARAQRGQGGGGVGGVAEVVSGGDANGIAGALDRERGRLCHDPQRRGDQQEAEQPDHVSRLTARSISRSAARLLRSSRRSWSFFPRTRASVTLA